MQSNEEVDVNELLDHVSELLLLSHKLRFVSNLLFMEFRSLFLLRSQPSCKLFCIDRDSNSHLLSLTLHIISMVGHETTAAVVSYTIDALARDRTRQDKLRAELTAAGFVHGSGKEATFDELADPRVLPYLDAVVKEG